MECPKGMRINYSNDWTADFHCMIYILNGHHAPTNVTMFVNWGDMHEVNGQMEYHTSGPTELIGNMTFMGTTDYNLTQVGKLAYLYSEIVHNYTEGGTYCVNVTLQNLVSNYSMMQCQRIIEKIVEIEFFPHMIRWATVISIHF